MHELGKDGKWPIPSHGDSLLRLAGARGVATWTPRQAEPVQPPRLPDGMIEVRHPGRPRPILYVLEISAYPYGRLARQATDDALLVYLEVADIGPPSSRESIVRASRCQPDK